MAIGPETIGIGFVGLVVMAFLLKVIDAMIGGFFGSIGESLFSRITQRFSSGKEDKRQFTGASFEQKLIDEIDDLNPRRETEIHYVDYDYKSGGSAILEYSSESRDYLKVRSEVENIAYAFASTISEKCHPCDEINVNVFNKNEMPITCYHVDRKWADSYNQGEMDTIEYIGRIMDTYEWAYDENEWEN